MPLDRLLASFSLALLAPLATAAATETAPLFDGPNAPRYVTEAPPWLEPYPGARDEGIVPDPRFLTWLDTRGGFRSAPADDAYSTLPLTAELWAAVRPNPHQPQVLFCGNQRESVHYWEIGVDPGSNKAYVYLPGREPERVYSEATIGDRRWHHLAAVLEKDAVTLLVDGRAEARVATKPAGQKDLKTERGGLMVGCAATRWRPTSDALIGEIRVTRGVRDIAARPEPNQPPEDQTVGLWRMGGGALEPNLAGGDALEPVVRHPQELFAIPGVPLDAVDLAAYEAGPRPMQARPTVVSLRRPPAHPDAPAAVTLLDGTWEMVEGGTAEERVGRQTWEGAIPAAVPGSVHLALERAGLIPDPKFGLNEAIAREQSFKTWWLRRTFRRPDAGEVVALNFNGVAISCAVWLNGRQLGTHNGMFGGPRFILDGLEEENELVVRLDPAPKAPGWLLPNDNNAWRQTVVFNNVWGWHYSNIPAVGIWRSVELEHRESVTFVEPPFVATHDAPQGIIDLSTHLRGAAGGWRGHLLGTIEREDGSRVVGGFSHRVWAGGADETVRLRFSIPNPELWWPNGYGGQPLYRLRLTMVPERGAPSTREAIFGIRTVRLAPAPGGPLSSMSNWTFVINGRPIFMRGSGWCTMDSSMDFSRERYDRFLRAARDQNNVMVRAWGSGMPETDDFYDLCDRYGLLVMQEWPTAWDSHEVQPADALEETVRLNTLRLRNHPSLVMWGGGNESWAVFTPMINLMGRISQELDGTRPFHRTEAYGGSTHNYGCWWDRKHLDHNLNLTSLFLGEFGIPSVPVLESVRRYTPEAELEQWPERGATYAQHTPTFNSDWGQDVDRLRQYAGYFTAGRTLADHIRGSQTAQAVALRHTLERARVRWPESTGALYYKLNDNYPAASWATWDWYGAPKIAHWFVRSAFAPLHATVLLESVNLAEDVRLPVHLLDDAGRLADREWRVVVRAYGAELQLIRDEEWTGRGGKDPVRALGEFALTAAELAQSRPLLLVAEVHVDGQLQDRSWSFANFEQEPDSLYQLPATTLAVEREPDALVIRNTGRHPALGVEVLRPGHAHEFEVSDGMLWLEPGESRRVVVSAVDGTEVSAWNLGR